MSSWHGKHLLGCAFAQTSTQKGAREPPPLWGRCFTHAPLKRETSYVLTHIGALGTPEVPYKTRLSSPGQRVFLQYRFKIFTYILTYSI